MAFLVPPRRYEYHPLNGDTSLKTKSHPMMTFLVSPRRHEYHPLNEGTGLKTKKPSNDGFSCAPTETRISSPQRGHRFENKKRGIRKPGRTLVKLLFTDKVLTSS